MNLENDNYCENVAEFSDNETIKNKSPNIFGNIHNKGQLEKSYELDRINNNEYCIIV